MQFAPGEILVFIVVFLFLFLGGFIACSRQGRLLSNQLLGAFFLVYGLTVLDGYLVARGVYDRYPRYAFWLNALPMLYGPLLYGYTRSVLDKDFRLVRQHLVHLLPFFLLLFFFIITYHMQPLADKQVWLEHARTENPWYVRLITLLLYGQIFAYVAACFRLLRRYRRERGQADTPAGLVWLRFVLIAFTVMLLLNLSYNLVRMAALDLSYTGLIILTAFIFAFILAVLIKALQYSRIFSALPAEQATRYVYSPFSHTEQREHLTALQQLMEEERLYLDPELTLQDLAERLDLSPKNLSKLINGVHGQHFFDFVNRYRIDAARRLLLEQPQRTISEILYEVGFNSKSSFNTAFRKFTGTTPSKYRKRLRES